MLTGDIEVQHAAFRYSAERPLVLRDLSLRIKPGEFVALVGPSGSGKSTLLRLLLGFEHLDSGAIYFDGQDLDGPRRATSLRRQIGVVLQNGRLMSGDIFTNIVGSSTATLDEAWEAARMAGFAEDIEAMPMGMHTVISEGGGTLSGGQRQRLLIARAIVHRPRILLFDEATSALDNRTQAIVSASLERLQATRIVVAHRLSTIRNADRISSSIAGAIVQSGTYDELMRRDGPFAELARRQIAIGLAEESIMIAALQDSSPAYAAAVVTGGLLLAACSGTGVTPAEERRHPRRGRDRRRRDRRGLAVGAAQGDPLRRGPGHGRRGGQRQRRHHAAARCASSRFDDEESVDEGRGRRSELPPTPTSSRSSGICSRT